MGRYTPVLIGGAALVVTGVAGLADAAFAQTTLCSAVNGPFATADVGSGQYRVMTDEWRSHANLCVATSGPGFSITKSAINQPVVGAYPDISASGPADGLPIAVRDLRSAVSDWRTAQVGRGEYNTSYDLTYSLTPRSCRFAGGGEVMVWIRRVGNPYPKGPLVASHVSIAGANYDVHAARAAGPGGHNLTTFVRTTPTDAVSNLDLAAFTRAAVGYGYLSSGLYLCRVQAGFELWRGGEGLATTSFSLHAAARPTPGAAAGPVLSGVAGQCLDDYHSGTNDGNPVVIHVCNQTNAQTWTAGAGGALSAMGTCLAIAGRSAADGAAIVISPCVPRAWYQTWRPGPNDSLVNPATGKCLAVPGTTPATGRQVVLAACRGGSGQRWRLAQ